MARPEHPDALDMSTVLDFLQRNPHIDVPVDTTGDAPALVFQSDAQQIES